MIRSGSLGVALALGVLLAVSRGDAAPTTAYSGKVVAINSRSGVLVLDEVGAGRPGQGRAVVLRRTVTITADTRFNTFIRANVPGAFGGDYLEVELEAEDVIAGDFVTVECVSERGRLIAVRVTVAEMR